MLRATSTDQRHFSRLIASANDTSLGAWRRDHGFREFANSQENKNQSSPSSSRFAANKSAVSNPSVKRLYTSASISRPSSARD